MQAKKGNHKADRVSGYHAHVYYDDVTRPAAAELRARIERRFEVRMGRWRDAPVGPHPVPSYQVAFEPELFGDIIPWLALSRGGLSILVHPQTGDDRADHSDFAMWLGAALTLDLDKL